jgi:hypothetical protein
MLASLKGHLFLAVCLITANLVRGQVPPGYKPVAIEAADCGSKAPKVPQISLENSYTVIKLLMNDPGLSAKDRSLFYVHANRTSDTTTYIQAWDMASNGVNAKAAVATSTEISEAVSELIIECASRRKTPLKLVGMFYLHVYYNLF